MTDRADTARQGGLQSVADPVTGAYSRALLDVRLPQSLAQAARADAECALFLFDVDYFKTVNDTYGHGRGDLILQQIADRVGGCTHPGDELFRYGGDEFVLLLPGTGKAAALEVAQRVVEVVQASPYPGEPPLSVSVSLGVASFPSDAKEATDLLEVADRRNYIAKRRGRGCAVADDVEVRGRATSSRLLQRDNALTAVHDFLDRLDTHGRGALRVTGEHGAGHSRFLAEVANIARLRGFEVHGAAGADPTAPAPEPGAAQRPDGPRRVLVVDDGDGRGTAGLIHTLDAAETAVTGLVYAVPGAVAGGTGNTGGRGTDPAGLGMALLGSVELTPWSVETVRIWLRTTLQGEPGASLVSWIARRSGGLPAKAERELQRLTEQAGLERTGGGWELVTAVVAGPSRSRYRLPNPVTEFIGREHDVADIGALVRARRLVTLTGPGGIGKTRLSLAVAAAVADGFHDGAAFVALEEATSPAQVTSAIAQVLGVAETTGQPLVETVGELLAERSLLLVLDNFEQALPAAPVVAQLLAAAPDVKVLTTSREPLRLYGEQVYPVAPLSLPDLAALPVEEEGVAAALAASPALALFAARAQAAAYGFSLGVANLPAVAELCHRLDGLPLAIELAAARSSTLSPAEMLAGIGARLDLLGDGPQDLPGRQRTLRAAIDWSLDLLDGDDRALFDRLGVFAGGCTLESAQAVCVAAAEGGATPSGYSQQATRLAGRLASLADKNLLRAERDPDGLIRYTMLETIRSYAAERLADGPDTDRVHTRHAAYYALVAEQSGRELTGPDQATWAGKVAREYPNLRAAATWVLDRDDVATAGRICVGLWRYWRNGSHIGEGRDWLARVLAVPAPLGDDLRAQVLHAAALLAATQDDYAAARELAADSLRLARGIGAAATAAQAVNVLGFAAMGSGDYTEAKSLFEQSLGLWSEQSDRLGMAIALGNLTKVALCVGDIETASGHASASLELDRAIGNTRGLILGLECLSQIRLAQRDTAGARILLRESLILSRNLGDVFGEAMALHHLGLAAQQEGDLGEAVRQVTAGLGLRHDVGDQEGLASSLETLAALCTGDPVLAARIVGATESLRERHRLPVPAASQAAWEAALAQIEKATNPAAVAVARQHGRTGPVGLLVDELLTLDTGRYLR